MNKRANVYSQSGIISLAENLANRSPMDFSPVPVPSRKSGSKNYQLVTSFNLYQTRMKSVVDRERSFNRYIGQEVRSSLMVIQGAIALLEESILSEFQERQRQRIDRSTDEMSEMLDTLVDLSRRHDDDETFIPYEIGTDDLKKLIFSQSLIVKNKSVTWSLNHIKSPKLSMPAKGFRTLIRVLSKSVFSQTMTGEVVFSLSDEKLYICICSSDRDAINLEDTNEYPLILKICEAYQLSLNFSNLIPDRIAIELRFKTSASNQGKAETNIVPFQPGMEPELK